MAKIDKKRAELQANCDAAYEKRQAAGERGQTGELTPEVAEHVELLLVELCYYIPRAKIGEALYAMNEIGCFVASARRAIADGKLGS